MTAPMTGDAGARVPRSLAHIAALDAYVPGQPPGEQAIRLASNENPYGCAPSAAQACRSAPLAIYPDGTARAVRAALADAHGLEPERIICGAGSDEIFHLLARAYLDRSSRVIVTRHAFLMYVLAARQSGAHVDVVAEADLRADVDAMLAAVNADTRMVFLANPNNPTGSWLTAAQITRLHAGLPGNVLLVLDGAYAEYTDDPDYTDGMHMARQHANVIAVRTFSKIHGLAGLRLGWAYGALEVISTLNRVRGPFNVSAPAIAAGVASIADTGFVAMSAQRNRVQRARLADGLTRPGLTVFPSQGNFLLTRFAAPDVARNARAALAADAIMVRGMDAYRLPDCLRITVGDEAAVTAVLAAMDAFVGS